MAECLLLKGGGADLDVVTAGAGDVLSGKAIVDKNGEPLTGTMPNKTGTALTVATNGKTLIPQGYHDGTQYATNSQATLAGGTLTPSTSQVTVNCNGKLMTSNYVIPAFSLPTASKLLNGYTYNIYGKSVTGTAQYYVKTSTVINASSGGTFTNISGRSLVEGTGNGVKLSWVLSTAETIARTGNTFNLTNYKYVKIGGTLKYSNSSKQYLKIGVSQKADGTSITWGSQITLQGKGGDYSNTGNAIVDVTSLSGMYYIYFYLKNSSTSSSNDIDEASCTISNT